MDPLKRHDLSNFGTENSLEIYATAHEYGNNLPVFLQQQQCHELLLHRQQQQLPQFSSLTLHQQLLLRQQQLHEQREESIASLHNFHSLISEPGHNPSSRMSSQGMQLTIKLEDTANKDSIESISEPFKTSSSLSPSSAAGLSTPQTAVSTVSWPARNPSRKPSGESMGSADSNSLCVPKLELAPNLTFQRQRTHTSKQTFECPNCGKIFSNSSAIAKHKLTHSDERKYVCSICNKAFKRQDHLNGHLLTHQDKKPHACTYCDKSYSDARSLRRHYENAHSDELRQLRPVSACGGVSSSPSAAACGTSSAAVCAVSGNTPSTAIAPHSPRHVNSTSPCLSSAWHPLDEPRNVECTYCSKKFKNQSALNGHMRLHGGYNLRRDDGPPTLVAATSSEQNDLVTTTQSQSWPPVVAPPSPLQLSACDASRKSPIIDRLVSTPQLQLQATVPVSMCNNAVVADLSLLGSVADVSFHTSLESIFQGMHCVSDDIESMMTDSFLGKATPPNVMSTPPHANCFSRPHYEPITPSFFPTPSASLPIDAHDDPRHCAASTAIKTLEYTDGDPTLSNLNCSALAQLDNVLSAETVTSVPTLSSEDVNLSGPLFHERIKHLSLPTSASCWPDNLDLESMSTSDLLFRDPAAPPPTRRFKHRPAPLVIPAHESNYAFASRLRSPRIWKSKFTAFGGCGGGGGSGASSPPPYTPPPMLSPTRQGSGLFWRVSNFSGASSTFKTGPMSAPVTRKPWSQVFQMDMLTADLAVDRQCEEVDAESDLPPPATDILPKINIGGQYQAYLPQVRPRVEAELDAVHARLLWDPECEKLLTEDEVSHYLQLSCSSAVPEGGLNQEHALHLLYRNQGNLQTAILHLLENSLKLCVNDPLADYTYTETEFWSLDDATRFTEALYEYEKDFFLVSQKLQQQGIERSVKHCVEFYYLWKHIWPHEYKVLHNRWRRRRAEQLTNIPEGDSGVAGGTVSTADPAQLPNSWYNLRNREPLQLQDSFYDFNCSALDSLDGELPILDAPENTWSAPASPTELDLLTTAADMDNHYPCKLCGRVFRKMKSRNAHMKAHNERNNGGSSAPDPGATSACGNRVQRRMLPDLTVM